MVRWLLDYLRRYPRKQHVRPWALTAPILTLIICLPLLRPALHPDPRLVSDDEQARLATVQAIVEHHTLAIEATSYSQTQLRFFKTSVAKQISRPAAAAPPRPTSRQAGGQRVAGHEYANQPPMMAALLAGPYWVFFHSGLRLEGHGNWWAIYLLTLLGVTLPVAVSGAMIYRMGRLFELPRPWRAALAMTVILASGLISYATVLNAHAPAAALVIAAACFLIHVTVARRGAAIGWIGLAGLCAALAATIDPPACVFLPLFLPVILVMRLKTPTRLLGAAAFVLAGAVPFCIQALMTVPVTGNFFQGWTPPPTPAMVGHDAVASGADAEMNPDFIGAAGEFPVDDDDSPSWWRRLVHSSGQVMGTLLGNHGILSHFPVLIFGVIGVGMVMHRHWLMATKVLASSCVASAAALTLIYALAHPDWSDAMFACRWLVVATPILLFWSGAWMRRTHRPMVWALFSTLLAFSAAVSILGAANPLPRSGYSGEGYTALAAWRSLWNPTAPPPESNQIAR